MNLSVQSNYSKSSDHIAMIYSPENKSDDESRDSNSVDLQLFSDDEDDQSFFEIAIHKTQHKHQGSDDEEEEEEEEEQQIELRISFSSSFVTSSVLWSDASKIRGRRDLLVVDSRQCPYSGDFSSSSFFSCCSASPEPDAGKTTTFQGRATDDIAANALLVSSSATGLDSNRDLTPASCPRKPPEKMTSPTVSNGSGILNFLIKFPAAIKLQKLLASFAKATATTPHDPKALGTKTTSSRRRLHKFLNKWIVPIRTELGLKNMKSYCSFDDDQYKMDRAIIITSNEQNVKKSTKTKTKRRGFSNPNSIKSSPAHQAPVINGQDHDHHQQSSIQAAIAHCRRSSTPDFCFSTPHDHHRPF